MINYDNRDAIQKMDDQSANLLLEVEFLMEAIKSGDLAVENGYHTLIDVVSRHKGAVRV